MIIEGLGKQGRVESRSMLKSVEREVGISTEEKHFERGQPARAS